MNQAGVASTTIEFSRPGMSVRKLGRYRAELAADDPFLAKIQHIIREHSLLDEPVTFSPRLPGSKLVELAFQNGEDQFVVNSHPSNAPLPPPLDEIERLCLDVMRLGEASPLRTIAVQTQISSPVVRPGDSFSISMTASNAGRLPVKFGNPALKSSDVTCNLSFLIWSINDKNPATYYGTLETTSFEFLTAERTALPSDVPYLQLAAGAKLTFFFRFQFPNYDEGKYELQLVYNGDLPDSAEDSELVGGGFHGDPVPIKVTR